MTLFLNWDVGKTTGGGVGIVLHRLQKKDGEWGNCEIVTGDPKKHVGWRDGCGSVVRFARPHDMMISPEGEKNLIITDIDNRALRILNPNKIASNGFPCVSTVSYDEGLYPQMFPEDKFEFKAKFFEVAYVDGLEADKYESRHLYPVETSEAIKVGGITYSSARSYCQSVSPHYNSDLCTMKEVRKIVVNDPIMAEIFSTPFWTKQSCLGCWLDIKGVCTENAPYWDGDFHMVAQTVESGLQTQCLQEREFLTPVEEPISVICCADGGGTFQQQSLLSFDMASKPAHWHSKVSLFCALYVTLLVVGNFFYIRRRKSNDNRKEN